MNVLLFVPDAYVTIRPNEKFIYPIFALLLIGRDKKIRLDKAYFSEGDKN